MTPEGGRRRRERNDEFPTPAPKRVRRSVDEGVEMVNGDSVVSKPVNTEDAMDVDTSPTSPSPSDADADGETVSPVTRTGTAADESDNEALVQPTERYDSMDVATQTDAKNGVKCTTLYWRVEASQDDATANLMQTIFQPNATPYTPQTLLATGENLLTFYALPPVSLDNSPQQSISHISPPSFPPDCTVTAATWHPDGSSCICALQALTTLPNGNQKVQQSLIAHSSVMGTTYLPSGGVSLLQADDVVLALRYSPDDAHLVVVRTNGIRGLIQVYHVPAADNVDYDLTAWRIFEHEILDAQWTSDDTFIVCGSHSLATILRLDSTARTPDSFTAESVQMQGLSQPYGDSIVQSSADARFDKLRVCVSLGVAVLAAEDEDGATSIRTFTLPTAIEGGTSSIDSITTTSSRLTGLAVQPSNPLSRHEETESVLVAATGEDGSSLYRLQRDATLLPIVTLDVPHGGPVLGLAWSKDGRYVAVCGAESLRVWDAEPVDGEVPEPVVSWRAEGASWRDDEDEDEEESEPCISWSEDGGAVVLARGRDVSFIFLASFLFRLLPEEKEIIGDTRRTPADNDTDGTYHLPTSATRRWSRHH